MSSALYFEDFQVGRLWEFGGERLTREEILQFARRYDPEMMHTDAAAAEQTIFGGLIASGLQTLALWRRMDHDHFTPLNAQFIVAGGLEYLRWPTPGRPGDVLHVHCTVAEATPLRSRSDRGIVKFDYVLTQQDGRVLMEMRNIVFVRRRPPEA